MNRIASLLSLFGIVLLLVGSPGCDQTPTPEPSSNFPAPQSPAHPGSLVSTSQPHSYCPETASASLVTGTQLHQTPSLDEPEPRQPFLDPQFGACLIRVTDRSADVSADDPSLGLKNEYSRVQSFNADSSLFIIRGTEATWYLYDAQSLQPLQELPLVNEPRWDASDPQKVHHIDESRLIAYDIQSGQSEIVHDFSGEFTGQPLSIVWTRYEGSPSFDGRYWGFMAQDADLRDIGLLI